MAAPGGDLDYAALVHGSADVLSVIREWDLEVTNEWAAVYAFDIRDDKIQQLMKATRVALARVQSDSAAGLVEYGFALTSGTRPQDVLAIASVKSNLRTKGPDTVETVIIDEILRNPVVDWEFFKEGRDRRYFKWFRTSGSVSFTADERGNVRNLLIRKIFEWAKASGRKATVSPAAALPPREMSDFYSGRGFGDGDMYQLSLAPRGPQQDPRFIMLQARRGPGSPV